MAEKKYDVVIIGGGPGGYVAAIRGRQNGLKVALVEANHLGGICLNWGCIPTKALLRSAEIGHLIKNAEKFGWSVKDASFDLKKITGYSRGVAKKLSGGVGFLMKKNGVDVFDGWGTLKGAGTVEVTKDDKAVATLKAKHVVLATGARARELPGLEPDGKRVWSYREAMVPEELPEKLLIIGSGAIGIEFASFYNDLGVEVTVVEVMDRILPVEDEAVSAFARKSFEKQGMTIHTGAKVQDLRRTDKIVQATIEVDGTTLKKNYSHVIAAVGITGNVEGIGLENTGAKAERSHIVVDKWCETAEPGLYAIGDVANPPWLAHKASHEGVMVMDRIAGKKDVHPVDLTAIPGCTYARPQVASVGLTEAAAKEQGYKVRTGNFPFEANGKAIALGDPEGFVKTVFDAKTGELLGAHMVGAEVTELIQGFSIAKTLETTEAELMATVFPHPTLSEMMHESILDAYDEAIHI